MVYVPPGTFWMGCSVSHSENECPSHEVYLDGFYIDTTEVTAGAYKACVDTGSCAYEGSTTDETRTYNNGKDDHPINHVSYSDAQTYCEWLGKRLPTEAEWEKAAGGTDGRKYPWGNEEPTCDLAWFSNCLGDTQSVGSLSAGASPYGAMDMAGNVYEWTVDWYSSDYYEQTPAEGWVNPEGPVSGNSRVLRGGSFYGTANGLRVSNRVNRYPDNRHFRNGFRCAQ
jgi:formylglycine-generating enzyme required for sulfatase activity